MRDHQHDVHDVNVVVLIDVVVFIVAFVPKPAAPLGGYLHDVRYIHLATVVEITEEDAVVADVTQAVKVGIFLIRVGVIRTVIADISHPVAIAVLLAGVGSERAVIRPAKLVGNRLA